MEDFVKVLKLYNDLEYMYPASSKPHIEQRIADSYRNIFREQYLVNTPHTDKLSGSQIGKPDLVLAWEKFFPVERPPVTFAQKRKWMGGHLFELEVMHLLERINYQYEWQPDVKVLGLINGHPDFVVTTPTGDRFIIECKHVSSGNYNQYRKGMNNLQYITQFVLYCTHYQCGGMWVIGNNDTGEVYPLVVETYDQVLKHYQHVLTDAINTYRIIHTSQTFGECLAQIKIPEPIQRKDSTYGFPPTLYIGKGQLHPCCGLYNFTVDNQGRYSVTGYNFPEDLKHLEPVF